MNEPSGRSLGMFLGWLAVGIGVLSSGIGFAYLFSGRRLEGVDCLLTGGLALVAGCVIVARRRGSARSTKDKSGHAKPDAPADGDRDTGS